MARLKFGPSAFKYERLFETKEKDIIKLKHILNTQEDYYIYKHNSVFEGYNIRGKVDSFKYSDETIKSLMETSIYKKNYELVSCFSKYNKNKSGVSEYNKHIKVLSITIELLISKMRKLNITFAELKNYKTMFDIFDDINISIDGITKEDLESYIAILNIK